MTTPSATTRPTGQLSLKDRLSRLTFVDACKLLGPNGAKLIQKGANLWDIKPDEHVFLGEDLFRLRLPEVMEDGQPLIVTITLMAEAKQRLNFNCTHCFQACEHVGAAFSLILEEKTVLGLAAAPKPRVALESLDEEELVAKALAERAERAKIEKMAVRTADAERPWTDYTVTNRTSGKSYRVALRGLEPGVSYCSCPDFRTNTLGTCKHILHVLKKVKRRFSPRELKQAYRRKHLAVVLRYQDEVTLRLLTPDRMDDAVAKIVAPLQDRPIEDLHDLVKRLTQLQKLDQDVTVYPDAEEFIQQRLLSGADARKDGRDPRRSRPASVAHHAAEDPASALSARRHRLRRRRGPGGAGRRHGPGQDDPGRGRRGVAGPRGRHQQGAGRLPRLAQVAVAERNPAAFAIAACSSSAGRPPSAAGNTTTTASSPSATTNRCCATSWPSKRVKLGPDHPRRRPADQELGVEDQRRSSRGCKSRFALVLTGTPLENRLDELYSVVQFVDDRRLGPGFRFFNKHRVVDEKGKVLGYKNLDDLRERPWRRSCSAARATASSSSCRRGPPRSSAFRPPTSSSRCTPATCRSSPAITRKKYITEMDLLRLQKALLMCRMAADSTFLVDKEEPGYSTKLDHLDDLFDDLFAEEGRKVVLFSEWTTMLDLIEPLLHERKLDFVRLDGQVPQKQRQELVHKFQNRSRTAACSSPPTPARLGLNLQAANTVINVDLPWNPAVLEQRIARAHRMGQKQPVQVYVLVTEGTIEENLLATLAAKRELALAALDAESEVDQVDLSTGVEELKRRLEVLLGAKPEAPVDETLKQDSETATKQLSEAHRQRVSAAGGELLGAAFHFLGELVDQQAATPPPAELVESLRAGLSSCVDQDADGKPRLTVTLPNTGALEGLAQALAKLLALGNAKPPISS